jgi:hypothetical protein
MSNILVISDNPKASLREGQGKAPYDGIVLVNPFQFPIKSAEDTGEILSKVRMAHDLLRTGGMLCVNQDNPLEYEFAILSYFSNYSILGDGIRATKTKNSYYIDIVSCNDNGMEWPSLN